MTSSLPPFVQAVSGALGSAAANVTSYPLDLVCTRLQTRDARDKQGIVTAYRTLKQIVEKNGVAGLYTGLETDTAATILSNFFYFYAYSLLRKLVIREKGLPPTKAILRPSEEIGIGFAAGVISRAISTPLSLVTVHLQTEKQNGDSEEDATFSSVVKQIYEDHGLRGFWKGFKTTTLLCLNPSLTFFFYQAFRRLFLRGRDRDLPTPRQAFLGAAISNALAVSILYPLILAKTRLQSYKKKSDSEKTSRPSISMFDIWKVAFERDGVQGLYQGLEAQVAKGFLSQGLTMMTKQRLERMVVALYLYRLRLRSASSA
ncbi:mitochondrial carrier [Schizopora paradoxa]|uniref:Mitochondrial carrier n=1 Tax=Schizopora paradoxa TaxID=27342 RepID=A0A0H2RGB3_9AGAM|nr:mitochondrial carrier [Schizopora paradoxa]